MVVDFFFLASCRGSEELLVDSSRKLGELLELSDTKLSSSGIYSETLLDDELDDELDEFSSSDLEIPTSC